MNKDKLFQSGTPDEDFSFNDKVAEVFDDMLNRSVPYYSGVISSIAELLRLENLENHTVYDLGCSTGTTLLELARWGVVAVSQETAHEAIEVAYQQNAPTSAQAMASEWSS